MSADAEPDLKLEIAHILTIDVVAYSTLLIHEQSRVMAELNRAVRSTARFRLAEAESKLTRLPTGDGMALVFFGDPEAPIECAMQICEELKGRPEVRLRMGIHSGPINQIMDVNDRSNVAGAGIDMAQRVMDCGDAGHILVSKRVADDLAPYSRWNGHLHDLGEFEVKHGRRVSVFSFWRDGAGNRELPRKFRPRQQPKPDRTATLGRYVVGFFLLAGALACALLFWPSKPFIAILPYRDVVRMPEQGYSLGNSLSVRVGEALSNFPGLKVMGGSSSATFKGSNEDARTFGRKLGVTHIVEGTVMRDTESTSVSVALIEVASGAQLWSDTVPFNDEDAVTLPRRIAQQIAKAFRVNERTVAADVPTKDARANDLYWRGRDLLNKRTPESIEAAKGLFAEAVKIDATFALARVGIADAYTLLAKVGAMSGQDAAARAWPEVSTALVIDDKLADAYASRGVLLNDFHWNWVAAESDFRRALTLNPNSVPAHHWYARLLAQHGRSKQALQEITAAQELEPRSPAIRVTKARIQFVAHNSGKAIQICHETLQQEESFASAYQVLAQASAQRGLLPEAIEAAKKYVELSGQTGWARLELAYAYAAAGDRATAARIVGEVTNSGLPFSPFDMATICAASDDTPGTLLWLQRAIDERSVDVIWIRVDPRLDRIRSDSGFQALIGKMNPLR